MSDQIVLRKHQKSILEYENGKMGIIAVPGSGKTFTLSYLASGLISSGKISGDQEILVVTLVNSAVDNFYQRVSKLIHFAGLIPNWGYRVRTLHGLAHDIIRERPELAGLDTQFTIIDEREAQAIIEDSVANWLRLNPNQFDNLFLPELDETKFAQIKRDQYPELLKNLGANFIRYAKDYRLSADLVNAKIEKLPLPLPLAEFGSFVYGSYQRSLSYRGAVDFDDLIRLSLQILESDPKLLERLRHRWPYILEDEAQDSSRLQEEILSLLAGPEGNWVRAGDPNQAIFETFTTANPEYLRRFFAGQNVLKKSLPTSSRSTYSIINLANFLITWTSREHPVREVRNALQEPYIEPVAEDDLSPNPKDNPEGIYFVERKQSPQEETDIIVRSLGRWLPENQDKTVAVLAPRNLRAFDLVDALRKNNIPCVDNMLSSTTTTRVSAGAITHILRCLGDPLSASKLATVYKVWRRADREDPELAKQTAEIAEKIQKVTNTEDFLYPTLGEPWQFDDLVINNPQVQENIRDFRQIITRWHAAIVLPIDQLVLTISQDIFTQPVELALAHKLAGLLRQTRLLNPTWQLPELTEELAIIARNERKFIGFSEDDNGFNPEKYKGKVVVATMHKAKGLEWDRVYLMSVNNYDFPSGSNFDTYISEKWYFQGQLNIAAEALSQLDLLVNNADDGWYVEGEATQEARLDYIRERLRLFYVGITRAKQELILSWNTGRRGEAKPALPFVKLLEYWQSLKRDLPR